MYRHKSLGIILTVLFFRTILAVLAQGIFSMVTKLSNHPLTYLESGGWWTVYGTLIDIGCFALPVTLDQDYSFNRFLTVFPRVIIR